MKIKCPCRNLVPAFLLLSTLVLARGQQACWLPIFAPSNTAAVITEADQAWWDFDFSAADNTSFGSTTVLSDTAGIPKGTYLAWCIDLGDGLPGNPNNYTATLYSSCDTNIDTDLPNNYPASVYVSQTAWHQINYLLNHKNGAYFYDVQVAIWNFIGGPVTPDLLLGPSGPDEYPPANVTEISNLVADAQANAANWQESCGDVIAVVVALNTDPLDQLTIMEVPYPCVPCISVSKEVACFQPTNNCTDFSKVASGYAGVGCSGIDQPAFCYEISITNCGTIPLTNIVVSDNLLGLISTNFFTNASQVLEPGAGITSMFSMSFPSTATNTVTVYGDAALTGKAVTNINNVVVTNGEMVAAFDSAVAQVDTASVTCSLTLSAPNAVSGNNDNNLVLPVASYYSTTNMVTLAIHVCNTGIAELTNLTINVPPLAAFTCNAPGPFNLAPGACLDLQLCMGAVSCPNRMNFNVSVTGQVAPDTNHCAVYDTNGSPISVCSSCAGSISCSTNTGCLAGNANLSGAVLLHCSAGNTNISGDSGLAGATVVLYGVANNALATNTTGANGNYSFSSLAAGVYYVLVTVPTNYIETYPVGDTNGYSAVTIVVCADVTNVDFGYADTLPPVITVLPGSYLGCNPTNIPTDANLASNITAVVSCGYATTNISHVDSNTNCSYSRIFTIIVTDTYGNSATNYVTNTWTIATLAFNNVPAGGALGCNPTNIPTDSSVSNAVTYVDTCSTVTESVTHVDSSTNCTWTRIFTISASDTCGDSATAYVTNTWTVATLAFSSVPASAALGCNPTNLPTDASVSNAVTYVDTCSTVTESVTHADSSTNCAWTRIFTITASDTCGDSATAYATNTWTVATLAFSSVPASAALGCNPTNLPTDASVSNAVTYVDTCSTVTESVSHLDTSTNCAWTRIFTITASDTCGDSATAYVTNTWTVATLAFNNVPAGGALGCNPASLPTDASISNAVSFTDTCSTVSDSVTHQDTNSGCAWTRIFTISASDTCGDSATAHVTNTWTVATLAFNNVPASGALGCNPASLPTDASVSNAVTFTDTCSTVSDSVTHQDTNSGCAWTRIFTITASDTCGDSATAYVTNTWTVATLAFNNVPAGGALGCNPASLPTDASVSNAVTFTDTCSTVSDSVSHQDTNSGCAWTRIFTITASDTCGDSATAHVTNTWTVATLAFNNVPAGGALGCNPASLPSDASVSNAVTFNDTCSAVSDSVTHQDTNSGCAWTRIFTITASDTCGDSATAYVTNTWTVDATGPVLSGVPSGQNLGCNPTNLPTVASVQAVVKVTDTCSTAGFTVTGACTTNSCVVTQVFTIAATNACNESAVAHVTNTWTADTTAPTLSGVPAGTNYGCNPTNLLTAAGVLSAVKATDTCSPATVSVTTANTTNGCVVTEVFTITATNACGNSAVAYVTNTWTADSTAPVLSGVPAGKSLGCNPTNVPTAASVQAAVKATDTCSPATIIVTGSTTTNGCAVTQVFSILATNACGNMATAYVTNTWTADSTAPVLSGVPAGANLGCNPTNIPTLASIQASVKATDTCSPATVVVTGSTATNGCGVTQVFTIIATNACGNMATAYVTNTWTALATTLVTNTTFITNTVIVTNTTYTTNLTVTTNTTTVTNITITTNCCTNAICGNFNSQNPGSGWVWFNAHCSGSPGSNCTVYCSNASVTLACQDGKSYSFPISNGVINFSSSCTVATNWFDGTTWHTTLPCAGDDGIFLQGCAIPWQSDFANCQSVCWTAVFCSSTPGFSCNCQWGAACYNSSLPSYGSIAPKACHNTSCPNGQYYSSGDQCGAPENQKPYCVGGGTGGGGANCTGSWSSTSTTCTFGTKTNITTMPITTLVTNTSVTTNHPTTPVSTITTNTTVTTSAIGPVLSGVPVGMAFGCNPTSVPTVASVQAAVTASATCSVANVQVTGSNTTNGCAVTQIFTITAVNGCGSSTTAYVTNTWTVDKVPPMLTGVPTNSFLGCAGITNLPGDSNVLSGIKSTDQCGGTASITVSHADTTNGCTGARTFTITATDSCGNTTTTNLIYTWTGHTPDVCTNSICGGFNSQNPGSGWLWLNAHCSGNPGSNCTLYCQNASVTLSCTDGKTYTFPVPNGQVNFSSTCTVATNWFDGTQWNTTLPCAGDDEIFLQGCAIPWQSDFANCHSVTWTGVFSCSNPGQSFNWQWGGACYANSKPAYTNICPKACHQTPCPNGQYYNSSDHAGCPENHKPYCVGGATGGGGANCTGSWSGTDTTCTFTAGTSLPPVLNGVPANDNLGINPTNIPTVASVLAVVTATDTCSPAPVYVTAANTTNSCVVTQIFTITATNDCGNYATAYVTNTWTTLSLTNHCTNTICSSFTSQNPGTGWVWFNSQLTGKPGTNEVLVICSNASVTLTCNSGKTYTYPVPNGQILFSPNCTTATNWFDGTKWNTTLPCGGDDQIFVAGCAIPWQSDFAGCRSVCWTGDYSCNQPGLSFNWQFGAACYNNSQPAYTNICPKACHQTWCQNGQYFNQGDNAGTPENHNPYCVGGGTGYGGSNCTGNFSNPGTCNF